MPKSNKLGKKKIKDFSTVKFFRRIAIGKLEKFRLNFSKLSSVTELPKEKLLFLSSASFVLSF